MSKQRGERCRGWAIPGGKVCRFHGGAAPQVKLAARERLALMVDPSLKVYDDILKKGTWLPREAITVAKDVLDRTGHKAPEKIEHSGAVGVMAITAEDVAKMTTEQLETAKALVAQLQHLKGHE